MIDYFKESKKYVPKKIKTLLVGESPPPNCKTYFYIPKVPVKEVSLPSTIFKHYFKKNPLTEEEYEQMLKKLQQKGIFLIDIYDKPIKIRDRNQPKGINIPNLNRLKSQIPKLKEKIKNRRIAIEEENIIFLLARQHYKRELKEQFPHSQMIAWKKFRESQE